MAANHSPAADASAFLPTTRAAMEARGWDELDVLFITGDAYIDHPAFGVPLLARLLEAEGYRVGILAQPDWRDPEALRALGRPRLFAAVSAGAMDSMVCHYTAAKRLRHDDAYTPGGKAGARPNRAVIAYTAAIKGAFKGLPVVIGGIEASLRRLAHYDYWDDKVRRSVLVDSKADLLIFGMGERALLEIARRSADGGGPEQWQGLPGTAFLSSSCPEDALQLPSFEAVAGDPDLFNQAFAKAFRENDPIHGRRLAQQHGNRWLIVEPPAAPLSEGELDHIYALPFTRLPHPSYTEPIPAYAQICFSLTSHRGCLGGCAFCAISQHQGRAIQSRSETSILAEVDSLTRHPGFKGTITDVGGPSANMYGLHCRRDLHKEPCRRESCLFPTICPQLSGDGGRAVRLLRRIRQKPGVGHVYIASGVRYDLLERQPDYFAELLEHHVGGLLKVAPESVCEGVTRNMRKPGRKALEGFLRYYWESNRRLGKRRGIVPYFMAGHPGCTLNDMVETALFLKKNRLRVEQVQEFTPTPGTVATCIYYTGKDPFTGEDVYVPRSDKDRRLQKALLLYHLPANRQDVRLALKQAGREDAAAQLFGNASAPPTAAKRQPGKPPRKGGRRR